MVEAIFVMKGNDFIALQMTGHAMYNPGNDIVCSAISALGFTLVGALQNATKETLFTFDSSSGNYLCKLSADKLKKSEIRETNTIFKTIFVGMRQIESKYGNHLRVLVAEEF